MSHPICHECGQREHPTQTYGVCPICARCAIKAVLRPRSCPKHDQFVRAEVHRASPFDSLFGDMFGGGGGGGR